MLFKDEVKINVKSGKGGDGAATFRREKFIPRGGPDGGDGGNGGSVILRVNPQLRTLSHLHNNQKFKANNGEDGRGNRMYGKKGKSKVIEVPMGTVVIDVRTSEILADLTQSEQECIVAHGGKGGRGNVWFKSSTNQTPFYAEKGKPGETCGLLLELKLIAHIGLVGFPNAGKSTLISRISNAKPKVANYPFTTLTPNLGVMTVGDAYTSVLIADIPGLIEGAHKGKGLGIEFLKHVERTSVLLFILDVTDDPFERFQTLKKELEGYSARLAEKPFLVALNKIDMLYENEEGRRILPKGLDSSSENEKSLDDILEEFQKLSITPKLISAVTGENLKDLKETLYKMYVEVSQSEGEEDEGHS